VHFDTDWRVLWRLWGWAAAWLISRLAMSIGWLSAYRAIYPYFTDIQMGFTVVLHIYLNKRAN
jgi:hypothetical protein